MTKLVKLYYKTVNLNCLDNMTWIEEKVADALTFAVSPKEFAVNSTALRYMVKKLIKTNGICPSIHEEWDSNTPTCDKECPCRTFIEDGKCCCGLYIKLKNDDDEETDD